MRHSTATRLPPIVAGIVRDVVQPRELAPAPSVRPKGKPRGRAPVARTFGVRVAWQPPTRQQQVLEAMQRLDRPADRRQVADMLGISMDRASSALRRLTAKGLLARHRKVVTMENPGLGQMLGRPYQFREFEVWSYRLTEAGRATERLPDPRMRLTLPMGTPA